MYMTKQIKSIYHKMNLTMSYNNMGIENVVPKEMDKLHHIQLKNYKSVTCFIKIELYHQIYSLSWHMKM